MGGSIGYASGGLPPECPFIPFNEGSLTWDEMAQSYPASTFTTAGPHTISFSGSRHYSNVMGELDYSWSASITFEPVDQSGNPF